MSSVGLPLAQWTAEMVREWFLDYGIPEMSKQFKDVTGEELEDFSRVDFVETAAGVGIEESYANKYYDMLMLNSDQGNKHKHQPEAKAEPSTNYALYDDVQPSDYRDYENYMMALRLQQEEDDLVADFEALRIKHEKEKEEHDRVLHEHGKVKQEYEKDEKVQRDIDLAKQIHKQELALAPGLFTDEPAVRPDAPVDIRFIYNDHLSEAVKSQKSNFGNSLKYKERLLLLLDQAPYNGHVTRRDELLLQLCWFGVHILGFTLFGGFIRDFLIRGETPTDLDFRADSANILNVANEFAMYAKHAYEVDIQIQSKHKGVAIGTLVYEGKPCRIDFIASNAFKSGTSVDFDVNNFQITAEKKVHQRVDIGMSNKRILDSLQRKQCRAIFYDPQRAQKMAAKGWTILNS